MSVRWAALHWVAHVRVSDISDGPDASEESEDSTGAARGATDSRLKVRGH